jgi:hypothetical protein
VNCLTSNRFRTVYKIAMTDESYPALDSMDDLRTDYLLIATGIGAALIALVYLLMS